MLHLRVVEKHSQTPQEPNERVVRAYISRRPLGELFYCLEMPGDLQLADRITVDATTVRADFEEDGEPIAVIEDSVELDQSPGVYTLRVHRRWRVFRRGQWKLRFDWFSSFLFVQGPLQWTVPAVMYGENRQGTGKFPRGGLDVGWSFREDRIAVPSCSLVEDSRDNWQAVYASPAQSGETVSSVRSYLAPQPSFTVSIPYSEEPTTYREKGILLGGQGRAEREYFRLGARSLPFEMERTFFVASGEAQSKRGPTVRSLYDTVWTSFENSESDLPDYDWSRVASLKLRHLRFLLLQTRDGLCLHMGKGNGPFQRYFEYTAGSFLVRGLDAAAVLARAGLDTGDEQLLSEAERLGQFYLGGRRGPGLHQDTYDLKRRRWGGFMGPTADNSLPGAIISRCNGETMRGYVHLYRSLRDAGRPHPEFLEAARETAEFYIRHQLRGERDGSFGRTWSLDGQPVRTDGTGGAHVVSFLAELRDVTDPWPELDEALRRAGGYYAELARRGPYYGDALDSDCVDKEAGISLLHALLDLYEWEPREEYLQGAEAAASHVLSWMWSYDCAWPEGTLCARAGLETLGLTAVSTAHHHLDFYGVFAGYDFLRLWRITRDTAYRTYGKALIAAAGRLIATPEAPLNRGEEYAGWQPEQVNQTNWDYKHHLLGTKGRYHTCVAWTVVLTLRALLAVRRVFPRVLRFRFLPELYRPADVDSPVTS